ncbi:MAG: hypothetical protein WC873_00715 [Candidatus Gracilibacteria bacterium]
MKKLFPQFVSGVLASQILGLIGLLVMATYGGQNGCWTWVNELFNTRGYESCGDLGGVVGLVVGAIFGVMIIHKRKKSLNKFIVAVVTILALILPVGLPLFSFLRDQNFESVYLFDLVKFWFVIFSPALVVGLVWNWKQIAKNWGKF